MKDGRGKRRPGWVALKAIEPEVHADFASDVRVDALAVLGAHGISLPSEQASDPFRVCVAYFNVAARQIAPCVRRVEYSDELRGRALPADLLDGVRLIEARSLAGESLAPHLSVRSWRPATHDWLLNDWGIHHLHVRPGHGDELLYAVVEPDCLYLVDLRGHDAMADLELLEIVLANWPWMLIPLAGIRGGQNPTLEELNDARRSGLQVIITLSDGKAYGPRGGGVTTARGSSARAVDRADAILSRASWAEEVCRNAAGHIAQQLGLSELRLVYEPRTDTVRELTTGQVVRHRASTGEG